MTNCYDKRLEVNSYYLHAYVFYLPLQKIFKVRSIPRDDVAEVILQSLLQKDAINK